MIEVKELTKVYREGRGIWDIGFQVGDIAKMQEAMNSKTEVKALLGEETLNQMNQFMQENGQAMSQMMQGQNLEAMNQMMNQFQGQKERPMNPDSSF